MAESCLSMDWSSKQSYIFLSPYLSEDEKKVLRKLEQKYAMDSHIWIASSGSSKKEDESLKLIALSKTAMQASAKAVNAHLKVGPNDVWGLSLPTFHVGGLGIVLRSELAGIPYIKATFEKWNPHTFTQVLLEKSVTLTSMVPTQVFDCVAQKLKAPKKLRAVLVGGAALSASLYLEARDLGWPLLPCYGMTETSSQIATATFESLQQMELPAMQVLSHSTIWVDESQSAWVRSPSLLTGYAYQKNGQDFFINPVIQQSWKIPDRIQLEGDLLRVLGRDEDFIKILAEGISLSKLRERWIQAALQFQIEVTGFELLAVPEARSGMALLLVVEKQIAQQAAWKKMLDFLQTQSAKIEWPSLYREVTQIPRSSLGKVLKNSL